jgi:cyclophilin family peptidyl-prolyl cis-trans isomerase
MPTGPNLLQPATCSEQAPAEYDAKFATTKGDFVIHVARAWAPLGADRFYNLVKNGFYDEASFFRIVPNFVVQFGLSADPKVNSVWRNANLKDDPVTQSNKPGYITFATAGANTRTTQVFISLGNNGFLDQQCFAPFGKVTSGMDIVKTRRRSTAVMESVPTGALSPRKGKRTSIRTSRTSIASRPPRSRSRRQAPGASKRSVL